MDKGCWCHHCCYVLANCILLREVNFWPPCLGCPPVLNASEYHFLLTPHLLPRPHHGSPVPNISDQNASAWLSESIRQNHALLPLSPQPISRQPTPSPPRDRQMLPVLWLREPWLKPSVPWKALLRSVSRVHRYFASSMWPSVYSSLPGWAGVVSDMFGESQPENLGSTRQGTARSTPARGAGAPWGARAPGLQLHRLCSPQPERATQMARATHP